MVDPRLMGGDRWLFAWSKARSCEGERRRDRGRSGRGHGLKVDPPLIGPARKKAAQRRRAVDAPVRARRLAPDADRDAAAVVHRPKAALVGEIVADEDRAAPPERL